METLRTNSGSITKLKLKARIRKDSGLWFDYVIGAIDYVLASRAVNKCRADLIGWQGESCRSTGKNILCPSFRSIARSIKMYDLEEKRF